MQLSCAFHSKLLFNTWVVLLSVQVLVGCLLQCVSCLNHFALQGHFLRDTPNLYLTALAIMSAPNLFGQLVGPVASALGLYFAGKEQANPASPKSQQTTTESAQKPS